MMGALFLWLPWSTTSGRISVVDALFTSTSAVCVTGLVVQDTPTYFTPIGQGVILSLIQLGGLGIMTFSSLILLVAGGKISMRDRILVGEGFEPWAGRDFRSLIKSVFFFTLAIESAGCLSLFLRFLRDFPPPRAFALSVFHSVSAFCNAGFSLFSDNLVSFRGDLHVNLTVMILIILGGLGFFVLRRLSGVLLAVLQKEKFRCYLHTKLVLSTTALLIIAGGIIFFVLENVSAMRSFSFKEKILSSLFQVVTARTAGFNTMDIAALGGGAVFLLILLMFIGASPGSTGGGVKTSTVAVITLFLKSKLKARDSVSAFSRTIPQATVIKAYTVISLSLSVIFFSSFIILLEHPEVTMQQVLFEVFSAFGTVGLSLGVTPKLSGLSKIMLILTMYTGRIGPLTLLYSFSRYRAKGRFDYVEENVMIG
jgi:trk system potassium uptake protein TrkH